MDGDNLGPAKAWQIREFPSVLRERLTVDALAQNESVGELLTRIVVAYFNAGAPAASSTAPAGLSIADLRNMAEAAAMMAQASGLPVPRRTARVFNGLIDAQVRAAAGLSPRKPRQPPPRIGATAPTRIESQVPGLGADRAQARPTR